MDYQDQSIRFYYLSIKPSLSLYYPYCHNCSAVWSLLPLPVLLLWMPELLPLPVLLFPLLGVVEGPLASCERMVAGGAVAAVAGQVHPGWGFHSLSLVAVLLPHCYLLLFALLLLVLLLLHYQSCRMAVPVWARTLLASV